MASASTTPTKTMAPVNWQAAIRNYDRIDRPIFLIFKAWGWSFVNVSAMAPPLTAGRKFSKDAS
jgi:hypothetical protein